MNRLFIIILLISALADAQNASALRMGDSLFALGDYSKAIKWYEDAQHSEEKIAKAYLAMGNQTKALTYYEHVMTQENVDPLSQYNYGKLLLSSNRYSQADSVFRRLSRQHPKNPEFQYQLGLVKEKQSDSTAYQSFVNAYALDVNHQNALYKIAKYAAERREFDLASDYIQKGLKADSNSTRWINLKAIVAFVTKDYHSAATAYEQLIQMKQSNVQLHENLGVSYRQTNRFEEAIEQYTILINEYNDKNPSWHFNLAKSYEALRYLDKAQRHYELSIILQDIPLDDAFIALSEVFKKQLDYKNQFTTLQKAVGENPENQLALYLYATAADNYFEDDAAAIPYYEKYLQKFGDEGKYAEFAKQRIKDINTDIHFSNTKN